MSAALPNWHNVAAETQQEPSTVANIVLPVDGSAISRIAVPVARTLARLYNATPHLVYVGEQTVDPKRMMELVGIGREELPGAVLDSCKGKAAEVLVRLARDLPQSVIVMCTHTGSDRFGSVVESVLAVGPDRIVLVAPERADKPWDIQRVLLAHDGTRSSDGAAAPAAEVAQRAGAEVIALHVAARKAASSEEPGSIPAPRYIDQPQHEWPAWTGEFMDRMLALGAPPSSVHFNLVVAGGQPGSEIAEIARERKVDLVVMPWDGKWSVAEHMATRVVIQTSGCPVFLVRSAAG